MQTVDLPSVRQDIEEALSVTRALPLSIKDQLCCGNFGRIDILHTASNVLGRLQLSAYALELSRQVLDRSAMTGFCFESIHAENDGHKQPQISPSLFLGLAGVGYTLLRLTYPGLFPSVLLLESANLN